MTRIMICGIAFIILASSLFAGCLNDDDPDAISFTAKVTGPWINDITEDQTSVGGYTDNGGVFFQIYYDSTANAISKYNNETGEREIVFEDEQIRDWGLCGNDLYAYTANQEVAGAEYNHILTHIDLETGETETLREIHEYGPGTDGDEWKIIDSTGDKELSVYILDTPADDTWDVMLRGANGRARAIEGDLVAEELLGGAALEDMVSASSIRGETPEFPPLVREISQLDYVSTGTTVSQLSDNHFYEFSENGFRVTNLSNLSNPRTTGWLNGSFTPGDLDVDPINNYAYLLYSKGNDDEIAKIDVSVKGDLSVELKTSVSWKHLSLVSLTLLCGLVQLHCSMFSGI